MATIDEELKKMRGAAPSAYTQFSQARGAEAIRGFGSGMAPRLTEPASIFGASAQQSSQDFSRLQMPPTQSIPLGNTIPAFPDNYNRSTTDRYRAPSAMVSGIRDTNSDFGIYGGQAQLGSGQTPTLAPVTDTISSFGNPMASRTERITSQYGTASTTLTPDQQQLRFKAQQEAIQKGTMPRTPEQQQALLAQMRERGSVIGQHLASEEATRQKGLLQGYYAFRQGLAESEAQEALSTERGRSPQVSRGAQALAEAERWKQAQAGRSPMSGSPLSFGGGGGPQPSMATPSTSMAGTSTMGAGADPFSYTSFFQKAQQPEGSPLAGFMAAINPPKVDRRFRPLPFGMRQFGVI